LRQPVASTTTELSGMLDVHILPSGLYYLYLRDATKGLAGGQVVAE